MERLQGTVAPATACHVHRGGDRRDKPIAHRGVVTGPKPGFHDVRDGVVPR